jgi:hypothetical protein
MGVDVTSHLGIGGHLYEPQMIAITPLAGYAVPAKQGEKASRY